MKQYTFNSIFHYYVLKERKKINIKFIVYYSANL